MEADSFMSHQCGRIIQVLRRAFPIGRTLCIPPTGLRDETPPKFEEQREDGVESEIMRADSQRMGGPLSRL
jgi:hypothetical protein